MSTSALTPTFSAPHSGIPAIAFFKQVHAAFRHAAAEASLTRLRLRIVDTVVEFCFAGDALIPLLTPALTHHEATPAAPTLTVYIWDAASTRIPIPAPPWPANAYGPRGEVAGYNTARIRTTYRIGSGVLSLIDLEQQCAVFAVQDAARLPYYEQGAPFIGLLHAWLARQRSPLVHAAAIGTTESGLLLVGKGGSGKSTTALACLGTSLRYLGDDYCALSLAPTPTFYSVYASAKLKPEGVDRLPHLKPLLTNADRYQEEKGLLFVQDHYPEQVADQLPARAILVPHITGLRDTQIRPTSAAEALRALAPSTLFQLPHDRMSIFALLTECTGTLPCYRLDLGTDLRQIPPLLHNLLSERAVAATA